MQIEAVLSAANVSPAWQAFILQAGAAPLGTTTLLANLSSWRRSGLQFGDDVGPLLLGVAVIAYARAVLDVAVDVYAERKTKARLELARLERELDAMPVAGVEKRAALEARVDEARAVFGELSRAGLRYADVAAAWEGVEAGMFDPTLLERRIEPLPDTNWARLLDELAAAAPSSAPAGAGQPSSSSSSSSTSDELEAELERANEGG